MVISLLLITKLALAQDFKNLNQGDVAPFSGTLITPEGIAKIVSTQDAELATCKEKARHDLEILKISKDVEIEKLSHDLEQEQVSCDSSLREKDKELDRAYDLIKKQNKNIVPLWIGLGFVGGVASTLGTIYAYDKITNE